ncbi:MAG: hypothetical protein PHN56_05085 [Candidatus Nanoarchaeia archaeon]|nr:hypothetical protein [Candidatus Nanoarchaeia archaeon]
MSLNSYTAKYEINGGASEGFGLKTPLTEIQEKIFQATPENAYLEAMYTARLLAENYLSNPETKKTTVKLLELYGPKGKIEIKEKLLETHCSTFEHLINCHFSREEYYNILK